MFELFFERSADAIWLFDPTAGVFVDCNQAAVDLMRAGSRENLLRLRPADLVPPQQPDGCCSLKKAGELASMVDKLGAYRFEWTARRCDGQDVPLEVLSTPIAANGHTFHVVISRDISERKRAEDALRESEEMFRLLFETSSDGIMILDPATQTFIDCNAASIQMARGGSREWLLSRPLTQLAPEFQPDGRCSAHLIRDTIIRAMEKGSQRFEWTGRAFNGEEFPMEVSLTPLRIGDRTLLVTVCRDVTERKAAEAALRESQQLLASVADNISEAVYRTGPKHELIFANRAYLRLSGYDSLAEMQRVPREQLYADPADRARLLNALTNEGGFCNVEIEYVRRDGHRWWGLCNGISIRDPKTNAILYHVGSVSDITERKRADEKILQLNASLERRITERTAELSASEARLRTLVEHAPEAIVVLDGETSRFLFGNAHACQLYGVAPEQLTSLTPAMVSPEFQPDGRRSEEAARDRIQQALEGDTPAFEWLHQRLDGRLVPTEVRLVRLPGEHRKMVRASIIDDTERKRRERVQQATYQISEAAHTTEDLQSLFGNIHTIVRGLMPATNFYIALVDPGGQTVSFPYMVDEFGPRINPLAVGVGLTGYVLRTGKTLLAGPHNTTDPSGAVQIVLDGEQTVVATPCGRRAEVWLGAPLCVRGNAFGVIAVQDYRNPKAYGEEEKQILTFVAAQIALAIERKRSQQALRDSEAELLKSLAREKELGQLKSNFVSMVSHEFRTPLGVIMSSAEILETYFDQLEPGDRCEQLRSIQKNTRRMASLMEEVLLLGMVEAGKMDYKPGSANLPAFCRHLIDELLSATDRKCPVLFTARDIPDEAQADKRLVRHIFSNLLSNAVKYSPEGSPVEFTIEREGSDALCRIRDRGLGIPEQDLAWLFNAFHRGRNVGHVPGTGLGLTIVKRCVELHRGHIGIESTVGEGTTVTVRLPVFT